nr:BolA family protein [uncultured Lichenicoccus sp.]
MTGTTREQRLRAVIEQRFQPRTLVIEDQSARHAGHAGVREAGVREGGGGGETHYALLLVSAKFEGVSRVQRSRLVHEALEAEFSSGLHALSLTLRSPREADK